MAFNLVQKLKKKASTTNCKICRNIPVKASFIDPERNPVEPSLKYIKELVSVPGKSKIIKCPLCGNLYEHSYRSLPYNDSDQLDIRRLSREEVKKRKLKSSQ